MGVGRIVIFMVAAMVLGCETLEPVLPKPVTADNCLLFVFRDPLPFNHKIKIALDDDTSVKLNDHMYTKLNQTVGDHRISVVKGLKGGSLATSYTYSCAPKGKYYLVVKPFASVDDEELVDPDIRIVPSNDHQALNRLQHFRFIPAMTVSQDDKLNEKHSDD